MPFYLEVIYDEKLKTNDNNCNNNREEMTSNDKQNENTKEIPLWISEGRIFKRLTVLNNDGSKMSKGIEIKNNRNRFSILNNFDKIECSNDNIVVNGLGSNMILQEKNEEFPP